MVLENYKKIYGYLCLLAYLLIIGNQIAIFFDYLIHQIFKIPIALSMLLVCCIKANSKYYKVYVALLTN